MSFRNFVLAALSFSMPTFAWAHEDSAGPHGGLVAEMGSKYHLEATHKDGQVHLYLLGSDGKTAATLEKEDGGNITVLVPGKPQQKIDIAPGKFNETSFALAQGAKATVLVNVKADGKALSAKIRLKD